MSSWRRSWLDHPVGRIVDVCVGVRAPSTSNPEDSDCGGVTFMVILEEGMTDADQ